MVRIAPAPLTAFAPAPVTLSWDAAGIVKLPVMLPPLHPVAPVSVAVPPKSPPSSERLADVTLPNALFPAVTRFASAAPVKLVPLLKFCVAP